jgi:hypothetical protein
MKLHQIQQLTTSAYLRQHRLVLHPFFPFALIDGMLVRPKRAHGGTKKARTVPRIQNTSKISSPPIPPKLHPIITEYTYVHVNSRMLSCAERKYQIQQLTSSAYLRQHRLVLHPFMHNAICRKEIERNAQCMSVGLPMYI